MNAIADMTATRTAVLDDAHAGHIHGAFGTIRQGDHGPRVSRKHRFQTLLAILGPGLIVMVGDNDAGAFGTYTQAGQNYGTTLLWTLLLLVPVLYVNQEMVLRLGAVTGVGHARLIFERFGKFWGAFSVIDLFLLNALTIVTEFIGIALALDYLGVPKQLGVAISAVVILAAVSTGNFRRFERFSMGLVFGSLLLIPIVFLIHPPVTQIAHDFVVPQLPQGAKLSEVMLLIIAIVGTTVAPWQLFFQQSYVVDKRITPRFIAYERLDLWFGIVLVIIGAVAMMAFTAATFDGMPEFGNFRCRWGRHRDGTILWPPSGRAVRPRPDRREHHRRLRGVSFHRVRHWRRAHIAAFVASEGYRRQGLLLRLLRFDCRCRRARADPRSAPRPSYQRCADARGRPFAERDRLPSAPLQ
jgi:hypothetical protein